MTHAVLDGARVSVHVCGVHGYTVQWIYGGYVRNSATVVSHMVFPKDIKHFPHFSLNTQPHPHTTRHVAGTGRKAREQCAMLMELRECRESAVGGEEGGETHKVARTT